MVVTLLLCFVLTLIAANAAQGAHRAAREREQKRVEPHYELCKPGRSYEEYQPHRTGRADNRKHDHYRPGFRCTEFDGACLC